MKIDLAFIKSYLIANESPDYAGITIHGDTGREICRIALWGAKECAPQPYTACICLPGEVEGPIDSSCAYILIGSDDLRFSSASRLVIKRALPKEEVYTAFVNMFYTVAAWKSTLLELMTDHGSVNDLVTASEEIFGHNPITVTDSSYLLLAHSTYTQDEPWFSDRIRTSNEMIFVNPEDAATEKSIIPEKPVQPFFSIDSTYTKDVRVLRAYIFSDSGFFMAWVTVAQHQGQLHHYHKQLLAYLSECIKKTLTNSIAGFNSHTSSALYAELLLGNLDTNIVDQVLFRTGWKIGDRFRVLILDTHGKTASENKVGFRLVNMLSRLMPSSKLVLFEDKAVIILHGEKTASLKSNIWTYIQKCVTDENIRAGVSNSSMNLHNISLLYEQALFALSCCSARTTDIILYKNVLTDHMLHFFNKTHTSSRFLHPYINHLHEYDEERDSSLVETLYYYLLYNRSHLACAKALHIHKSTFLYRLKTINGLLPIDYDNPEECLNLMLSARILLNRDNALHNNNQ